ncbi:cyclic lactone autoinducer peptide [Ruminococcus sp. AM43-6]|nr:cyclic lactone autoinducer peptide [Ruminococcus bicirculans (ex Wegman et al. 2014)]RGH34833.1 cyclic lactone autoinducer peptide [Ruminococcus sp. AM43-6]
MMKRLLSRCLRRYGKLIAALALAITTANVNSCCIWINHQPELPDGANNLRKF